MKQIFPYLTFLVISVTTLSCNGDKSFAELQNEETALIADYIKRNNINVITTLPKNDQWGEKDYYKSSSGLYLHMVNIGDTNDTVKTGSKVTIRHKIYTLTATTDTLYRAWTIVDSPTPQKVVVGIVTGNSQAIQESITLMNNNNSQAKIIIPSNLNTANFADKVLPVGMDIKIKTIK